MDNGQKNALPGSEEIRHLGKGTKLKSKKFSSGNVEVKEAL